MDRQKQKHLLTIIAISLISIQLSAALKFGFFSQFRIHEFQSQISITSKQLPTAIMAALLISFQGPLQINAAGLQTELETYAEETESYNLKVKREPKNLMTNLKKSLTANLPTSTPKNLEKELADARERVLTLKAYLDEVERDLFEKNWENLQVYIYTFADQENAFAILIDNLFPNNDLLDKAAREALSFEAQSMFLALDDLREAAKDAKFKTAQRAYSRLILSYDRFLKAGDLYPTYDAITSTEIFFTNTPKDTLRYSSDKVQVLDTVVLTSGPDMGKQATVIMIDGPNAVIKLDKDGKAYQEVKYVKLEIIAKALEEKFLGSDDSTSKKQQGRNLKKFGMKIATAVTE
jgi:hypothetical protein